MKLNITILYLIGLVFLASISVGQEKSNDQAKSENETSKTPSSATVKGRIVQNVNKKYEFDLSELQTKLRQQVALPPPPLPDNWEKLTMEQRQQWVKEFESSDEGKTFLADRKKRIDDAAVFDIQVEDNGNFVVYEVPHGTYGIRGRVEKQIDEKNYILEVFGQIEIAKEVEEVLLDPMMVSVTRRLSAGSESTPKFEIPTFDGQAKISNRLFTTDETKEKFILMNFWSMKSPPSQEFGKAVQSAYAELGKDHPIQLLSICIDSDPKKALEFVKTMRLRGWHGYVDSWEHEMINEFGVRVLPALFLISPQQKVIATDADFRMAFRETTADGKPRQLGDVIASLFTKPTTPTPQQDNSSN